MATKKKSKKKSAPKTRTAKRKLLKKARVKSKPVAKKAVSKKLTAKKVAPKKVMPKRKAANKPPRPKKGFAGKAEVVDTVIYEPAGLGARSGGQSGDLQGLSDRRRAGSESVDELLEEGNAFEAEVVKGVEDVKDEEEVHTHEVPEDDVPGEYLDKD
jgi:hypothetical protein